MYSFLGREKEKNWDWALESRFRFLVFQKKLGLLKGVQGFGMQWIGFRV